MPVATRTIELVNPHTVRYEVRSISVGPQGFALLSALCRSPRLTIRAAKLRTWGDDKQSDAALKQVCYRLNLKLLAISCPARVGMDRGRVILAWPPVFNTNKGEK